MSQFNSIQKKYLSSKIAHIEKEIISLKTLQGYTAGQMKFGFQSNKIRIDSYRVNNVQENAICSTFIYTGQLPNALPQIICTFDVVSGLYPPQICNTYEKYSDNSVRIKLQLVNTVIPFDDPGGFSIDVYVISNIAGTLRLEKNHTLPDDEGYVEY